MAGSRRSLLARAGVAATAAAVPPSLAGTPSAGPDPHVAWAAELRGLDRYFASPAYEDLTDEEADALPHWPRWHELQRLIARTQARTVAGVREQIYCVRFNHDLGCTIGEDEERAMDLALATLDRLAGRGDHA